MFGILLTDDLILSFRFVDQKDSKSRKKAIQAQLKTEHSLAQSTKIWNQDVLPNWEKVSRFGCDYFLIAS